MTSDPYYQHLSTEARAGVGSAGAAGGGGAGPLIKSPALPRPQPRCHWHDVMPWRQPNSGPVRLRGHGFDDTVHCCEGIWGHPVDCIGLPRVTCSVSVRRFLIQLYSCTAGWRAISKNWVAHCPFAEIRSDDYEDGTKGLSCVTIHRIAKVLAVQVSTGRQVKRSVMVTTVARLPPQFDGKPDDCQAKRTCTRASGNLPLHSCQQSHTRTKRIFRPPRTVGIISHLS